MVIHEVWNDQTYMTKTSCDNTLGTLKSFFLDWQYDCFDTDIQPINNYRKIYWTVTIF